jgi:hypothetical protein
MRSTMQQQAQWHTGRVLEAWNSLNFYQAPPWFFSPASSCMRSALHTAGILPAVSFQLLRSFTFKQPPYRSWPLPVHLSCNTSGAVSCVVSEYGRPRRLPSRAPKSSSTGSCTSAVLQLFTVILCLRCSGAHSSVLRALCMRQALHMLMCVTLEGDGIHSCSENGKACACLPLLAVHCLRAFTGTPRRLQPGSVSPSILLASCCCAYGIQCLSESQMGCRRTVHAVGLPLHFSGMTCTLQQCWVCHALIGVGLAVLF